MSEAAALETSEVRLQRISDSSRILVRSLFFAPTHSFNHEFFLHPLLFSWLEFSMLSRRVLVASRLLRARPTPHLRYPLPFVAQQFRYYAEKIVKVPEMAESISEGTLKQWSKQIGDFVEQDEEIATIETDKVRCCPPRLFGAGRLTSSPDRCSSQCA
jgi:Biotin-requiring enzyme